MNWRQSLRRRALPESAENVARRVLRADLPRFQPPSDAAAWRRRVPQLRRQALSRIYLRGWPAGAWNRRTRVAWGEVLEPHPAYRVRKLRYEAAPRYWIPALLYEPTALSGRVPVVLNPNGHHHGGKACDYKQARCINLARRGMIALNIEFVGMGELGADRHHNNLAWLDLTGMAGVGLMVLALRRALDVLLGHRCADRGRVAVTGLSGGGWQTIVISALDRRVTVSVPVAGYTSNRMRARWLDDIGDLEQVPADMARVFDYPDMTAMVAPRPALVILNEEDDCCFRAGRTRPVIYDAVRPAWRAFGALDRFETYSNRVPGTHNYAADNRRRLYRFLDRQFGLATPDGDLHAPGELFAESELRVGLPPEQESIQTLARRRVRLLGARRKAPRTAGARRRLRKALVDCLRLPCYEARGRRVAGAAEGAQTHVVALGPWRVSASVWRRGGSAPPALHVVDGGRAALAGGAVDRQRTHVAADILGQGECALEPRLVLMLQAAGHRALGIQVAQVLALARWAASRAGARTVGLETRGPVTFLAGLIAAALEPGRFDILIGDEDLGSLGTLVERGLPFEAAPSLCCFGLLELADVPELLALLEGVVVRHLTRGSILLRPDVDQAS